jgi:hypothetical protein
VTLIEHDNTQNNANHIHSVWRDLTADFGNDALAEHYRRQPHRPVAQSGGRARDRPISPTSSAKAPPIRKPVA